ncbi:hypothetical protein OS188_06210 [Xanthomarina sp. F1114]|uniref:hypothetical protein n=1 Tax=Xanthomarina sp. F1114 TaxID=2996019 RepID=UPI00225E151D|nr:hypothetical protein [Xanthomarina sp. F1114]MCX7547545.1 hypothetical protein [Xanthomarina sp. F1114]
MELNNIENLLEKYENGETTLKEEQELKNYFSQETVATHLEIYKPMFTYFTVNQKETFTKTVPLKSKKTISYKWISVAAVAILLLGIFFNTPIFQQEDDLGTFDDPMTAYNEVVKSLELISNSLNKGTEKLGYLDQLDAGMSKVGYLDEMETKTKIIFK